MSFTEALSGIYRIGSFDARVVAGFSGRYHDNSKRSEFLSGLGLDVLDLVMVKQVHGSEVLCVENGDSESSDFPADGLITDKKGLVLGIRTADCVPVFFHDPVKNVVGLAHGGWRGVKDGIIPKMIGLFRARYQTRPGDLRAAIGPFIRACCYEVGVEFSGYFPGFYRPIGGGKGYLDLSGVVRDQLTSAGVPGTNIRDAEICTVCRNDAFYSYRVERQTKERILNVISLVG